MGFSAFAVSGLVLLSVVLPPPEAAGGEFAVLAEGTPVVVKVTETLDPAGVVEGGRVALAVAEKVRKEGTVLIEKGAPVEARIAAGGAPGDGRLFLLISSARAVDRQDVTLRAAQGKPGEGEGGADSAAIPLEIGRPLAAGTTFLVYAAAPFFIEE